MWTEVWFHWPNCILHWLWHGNSLKQGLCFFHEGQEFQMGRNVLYPNLANTVKHLNLVSSTTIVQSSRQFVNLYKLADSTFSYHPFKKLSDTQLWHTQINSSHIYFSSLCHFTTKTSTLSSFAAKYHFAFNQLGNIKFKVIINMNFCGTLFKNPMLTYNCFEFWVVVIFVSYFNCDL